MLKKVLKITGVVLLVLVSSLFAIPYFFKDQIKAKIAQSLNDNLNAKVSFADVDLSLFRNFPNATVKLDKFLVINKAPFEGDTLVSVQELNLKMSIGQLFNGEKDPLEIGGIATKNGVVNVLFNQDGVANFDITKKDTTATTSTEPSKPLLLKIKNYTIENFKIKYFDQRSKIKFQMDSLYHSGEGDLGAKSVDLKTNTSVLVSLDMDKVSMMKRIKISLDAVLGIDTEKKKYTFKENKAKINELPLEFDGFVQMLEKGQDFDLKFKTPTSSFENFLGLIPSAYSGSIKDVKTTGNFSVNGFAKGQKTDTTVPKFNVEIVSKNASFQYPNLPKSIKNIMIDTKIINETGLPNDTYINLNQLAFAIDNDVFNAKANIKNVATNPLIDAALSGTINLANLSKAYPIKLKQDLTGILTANVTTVFDMNSVKTAQYQNIKNAGQIGLKNFKYVDDNKKAMQISSAFVAFNPSRVDLKEFKATTGKTDLSATGTLDNLYGFLFNKQVLKGNFVLNSNQFAVADFLTADTKPKIEGGESTQSKPKTSKEAIKIPAFLDCTVTANATTVLYDNLVLKNVTGKMQIANQNVTLQNLKTNVFDGTITLNGNVSTKEKTPTFGLKIGMDKVDINQTFTQLNMMKKIAPIAGIINGKINTTMNFVGNLNAVEMTPDVNSISGDLFAQLLSTTINSNNSAMFTALTKNLKFIDMNKVNLNDIKANLFVKDGKVVVKPFDIKYLDAKVNVSGSHGFDQNINYGLKLDLPAKYLGTEASGVLSKLSTTDIAKLPNIPVGVNITGSFAKPIITTDMKSVATALATQIINQQKDKLIKKGTSALEDLLKNKKDTAKNSKNNNIKEQATKLIDGIFGKKK